MSLVKTESEKMTFNEQDHGDFYILSQKEKKNLETLRYDYKAIIDQHVPERECNFV